MTDIKFDNSEFLGLGIHYTAQQWTAAEVLTLTYEYISQSLTDLLNLVFRFEVDPQTVILSTYVNKTNKQTYFSLPCAMLNKEGQFSILIGKAEVPLTFDKKVYTAGDTTFKIVPRRKDAKDNKSPIGAINLVAEITQQDEEGIEETFSLYIPIRFKKDSDLNAATKALQAGEIPDSVSQLGKGGGGLEPFYKPWMLPKGFYRLEGNTINCKYLPTGGKIWEGSVKSMADGQSYKVRMNAAPFVVQQRETLLIAAAQGHPVYAYIGGAYNTSVGIGAIAHAARLPEQNGEVPTGIWQQFQTDCKVACAATASKNSDKLLTDAEIAEKRAEFEANEQARIAEWIAKKNAGEGSTTPPELVTVGAPEADDIPF